MSIKHRLQKLEKEKEKGGNLLPCFRVIVDQDEDEEIAINEKLEAEGMTRDQCNLIVQRIIDSKVEKDLCKRAQTLGM